MEANKIGRPTDYKPEYCERVIELGKEGFSHAEIAADLGVCRNTLYNWAEVHPDFLSASMQAKDLAQAWFERIGRLNMVNPTPGFSAPLWSKQVSCRFPADYTEKTKQEVTGDLSGLTVRFVKGKEDAG